MIRMRRTLLALAAAVALGSRPLPAQVSELDEIDQILKSRDAERRAARQREQEENSLEGTLTPQEREQIVDKVEAVERASARRVGLREAGNPHIRKGLLLRNLADDPERSRVDAEALRRATIAQIERPDRESQAKAPAPRWTPPPRPAPPPRPGAGETARSPAPEQGTGWGLLVPGLLLLGLAGFSTFMVSRRPGGP
jgi:hypothetical protein